ncbi:cytochrome p450 domain-containing protein [Trichoderma breve]|uniref:Cytochrome p450 domain-containing protein n=1 Tax=Trichoderma breve TaxID=2034170 RepID=A0A9W9E6P6_9HYPO|nr:cytochrome p450 domain-containing protein [Trichoderma breve]KAJ4859490.1 cytochrome p450 domain-containing protein [Trichoderma breve]
MPPGTRSPPGPVGKPIIGSMLDIPFVHSWFKFKELTDQYGPITKITIAGQDHVLLGTEQVAQRSAPRACFFHHVMSTKAAAGYASELEIEATRMARDLIRDPSNYKNLFERYSGGIILRLAVGVRIERGRDPRCQSSLKAFLPEFLGPWKTELKELRNEHEMFFCDMLDGAKRDNSGGKGIKSWANVCLSNTGQWSLDDLTAAHMFGGLLEAGSGTSSSLLMSFCLLMTRTGQLKILQQELDRVVGAGRVPTIADLPQLPTVRAFAKEVLRFYPVTSGGAPHMLTKDDVYKEFFFKAGTISHANQWAIHRDVEQYPDPESFNPQRWLDPKYPTYRELLTQYPNLVNYTCSESGRRICPGQHIAELSVFPGIAMIAWGCNISKAKDDTGQDITPPFYDFNIGFNVQPNKFLFKL